MTSRRKITSKRRARQRANRKARKVTFDIETIRNEMQVLRGHYHVRDHHPGMKDDDLQLAAYAHYSDADRYATMNLGDFIYHDETSSDIDWPNIQKHLDAFHKALLKPKP